MYASFGITLFFKVEFMPLSSPDPLAQLQDIRLMMSKSTRFISLSGWSGIIAGTCALIGAYMADHKIKTYYQTDYIRGNAVPNDLYVSLLSIAISVFVAALAGAVFFTFLKSKKDQLPFWSPVSRRLLWNTFLPIAVGAVFVLSLDQARHYDFVAPACLIFYGLGLLNGSKYTLGEIRYLGYAQLLLGILNLFAPKQGLLLWALGFGVCHIIYGFIMWWNHERSAA
ncbi:MAG: hypothetical protein ACOYLG_11945 [Chitinophagaceae bacterium]|jgi:hypothetical protein